MLHQVAGNEIDEKKAERARLARFEPSSGSDVGVEDDLLEPVMERRGRDDMVSSIGDPPIIECVWSAAECYCGAYGHRTTIILARSKHWVRTGGRYCNRSIWYLTPIPVPLYRHIYVAYRIGIRSTLECDIDRMRPRLLRCHAHDVRLTDTAAHPEDIRSDDRSQYHGDRNHQYDADDWRYRIFAILKVFFPSGHIPPFIWFVVLWFSSFAQPTCPRCPCTDIRDNAPPPPRPHLWSLIVHSLS